MIVDIVVPKLYWILNLSTWTKIEGNALVIALAQFLLFGNDLSWKKLSD